jgi:hypothetical protein
LHAAAPHVWLTASHCRSQHSAEVAQGAPAGSQKATRSGTHAPDSHVPLQHSCGEAQAPARGRHCGSTHTPPAQEFVQHSPSVEQDAPAGSHVAGSTHSFRAHARLKQQSVKSAQAPWSGAQVGAGVAHWPALHSRPVQHGEEAEQLWPEVPQAGTGVAHWPASHSRPVQHGDEAEQLEPEVPQAGTGVAH